MTDAFPDHLQIYQELKSKEYGETFRKTITRRDGIRSFGGMSGNSSEGTQHSYSGRREDSIDCIDHPDETTKRVCVCVCVFR